MWRKKIEAPSRLHSESNEPLQAPFCLNIVLFKPHMASITLPEISDQRRNISSIWEPPDFQQNHNKLYVPQRLEKKENNVYIHL
jgi:hypothetical protein